jgi:nucleoside-diphosphate-sugar epimerase
VRILITGNMGYVGSVLVKHLRERLPQSELIGYDAGFFGHCLTSRAVLPETCVDRQVFGDVRDLPSALLEGVTGVVHLAAVSNDPMGNRFERATDDINHMASARLGRLAHDAGVRSFVFASSCSIYGAAGNAARVEDDPANPLTAYARSKLATEGDLLGPDSQMTVTCLRFATACGMSDRLRLDLVLNDFVACALASGEISVLSDGTPWRPLIDVADMALALEWALLRGPDSGGRRLVVNTGSDEWNYTVRDLAMAVQAAIPGVTVSINADAPPDKRSYRVDFGLFRRLAPEHQPRVSLEASVSRVVGGLRALDFADREFRSSQLVRLQTLSRLIADGSLSDDLRWQVRCYA